MKNLTNFAIVGGLVLAAVLGCTNQKNSNSAPTTNQTVESTFTIPPDSVPATEITRDFDNKQSDLQAAITKWRHKRVTFHGTVYTVEREDSGKFDVSLAGHDGMFTVFCEDIPASQASVVAKLREDHTTVAINGVILGNGVTGLVPGRVDHDVKAEKCKIVE